MAVEADWPDAYGVNRFVRRISDDAEAVDALGDFQRFPTGMWRNADVLDFIGWLRDFGGDVSFYASSRSSGARRRTRPRRPRPIRARCKSCWLSFAHHENEA